MISFDLRCGAGHVFEAWFGSSEDYESQRARNLVSCPMCDDTQVEKAVMAPAIRTGRGDKSPAETKAMLEKLARMQAEIEKECDYVGDRFADEARRRHENRHENGHRKEQRGIIGRTTRADAVALFEDGIPVMPLPFRLRRNSDA